MTNNFNTTQKILITTLTLLLTTGLATADDTALELTGDLDLNENNLNVDETNIFDLEEENPFIGADLVNSDSIEADAVTDSELADGSVDSAAIQNGQVGLDELENSEITIGLGDAFASEEIQTALGDDDANLNLALSSDNNLITEEEDGLAVQVEEEQFDLSDEVLEVDSISAGIIDEDELEDARVAEDLTLSDSAEVDADSIILQDDSGLEATSGTEEGLEVVFGSGSNEAAEGDTTLTINAGDALSTASDGEFTVGKQGTVDLDVEDVSTDELQTSIFGDGIEDSADALAVALADNSGLEFNGDEDELQVNIGNALEIDTDDGNAVAVAEDSIGSDEVDEIGDNELADEAYSIEIGTGGEVSLEAVEDDGATDGQIIQYGGDDWEVSDVTADNLDTDSTLTETGPLSVNWGDANALTEDDGDLDDNVIDSNDLFDGAVVSSSEIQGNSVGTTEADTEALAGDGLEETGQDSAIDVEAEGDSINVAGDGISVQPGNIDVEGFSTSADDGNVFVEDGDSVGSTSELSNDQVTEGLTVGTDGFVTSDASVDGDSVDSGTVDREHIDTQRSHTTDNTDSNPTFDVSEKEVVELEEDVSTVNLEGHAPGEEITLITADGSADPTVEEEILGFDNVEIHEDGDTVTLTAVDGGTEQFAVTAGQGYEDSGGT